MAAFNRLASLTLGALAAALPVGTVKRHTATRARGNRCAQIPTASAISTTVSGGARGVASIAYVVAWHHSLRARRVFISVSVFLGGGDSLGEDLLGAGGVGARRR